MPFESWKNLKLRHMTGSQHREVTESVLIAQPDRNEGQHAFRCADPGLQQRIMMCVNACTGFSIEELRLMEESPVIVVEKAATVRILRDQS